LDGFLKWSENGLSEAVSYLMIGMSV